MSFWSKLFGLKQEEAKPEIKEDKLLPFEKEFNKDHKEEGVEVVVKKEREYKEDICGLCNLPIGQERYKKVQDKLIHKKCFKAGEKLLLNGR